MNSVSNNNLDDILKTYENSPYWKFVNYYARYIKVGEVSLELKPREELLNLNGTVHGGVYASILDTTMGLTARTVGGTPVTTLQLNIQYLKSVTNQMIYSVGNVISKGKTTVLIEGKLYNESDELLAHCTGTFKLL